MTYTSASVSCHQRREGDGKLLGQRGHREGYPAEEGIEQAEALIVAGGSKSHADQQGDRDQPRDEGTDSRLQRRALVLAFARRAHDLTIHGVATGEDDPEPGLSGQKARARRRPLLAVGETLDVSERAAPQVLAHRHRLARQG